MANKALALVLLATGFALAAFAVRVQLDPLTLTARPAATVESASSLEPPPLAAAELAAPGEPARGEPVETSAPSPKRRAPVSPAAEPPRELVPCSDWEHTGPMYLEGGEPLGATSVRTLC